MGESAKGRDHTINHSEEVPWITQGEMTALSVVHLEDNILPLQGKKANWESFSDTQQQGERCAQDAENLLTFHCELQ